jgi:hypothetical protein
MLKRVIKKIANDVETFPDRRGTGFRFGAALDYVAVGNRATSVAEKKVAVARTYVQESAGAIPDAGDLSSQLGRIVELIKRANGSA